MSKFRKIRLICCLASIVLLRISVFAMDKDVEGSKDHPLISRYPGSVINAYSMGEYDEYTLPLDKLKNRKFSKVQKLEGKVTQILYEAPVGRTTLEIYRNYETALKKGGFLVLFSGAGKELAEYDDWPSALYPSMKDRYLKLRGEATNQRYLSAKLSRPSGDVYVSLYISLGWYKYALIELDVIETKPMESGLIKVDAATLANSIKETGHASIYGIYFDTNKTEIKSESEPALKEISNLLNQNPSMNLYIVGHTDNVGTLEFNMDISQRRAQAVVDVLVSKYGIDKKRLSPAGVGLLSPVGSNKTEEGRAINRRVELIEQ